MSVLVTDVASLLGAAVAEALLRRGTPVVGQVRPRPGVDPRLVQERLARLGPLPGFTHVDEWTLPDDVSAVVQLMEPAGHWTPIEAAHRLERALALLDGCCQRLPKQPCHLVQVAPKSTPEELLGRAFARRHGLPVTSFRTTAIYATENEPDQLFQRLADALAAGRPLLLPPASTILMPLSLDDAVTGVLATVDRLPAGNPPYRRSWLAGPEPVSPRQLTELLAQALGVAIAGELPISAEDDAEAPTATRQYSDWQPTVSLADGIARFAAWYRSRR